MRRAIGPNRRGDWRENIFSDSSSLKFAITRRAYHALRYTKFVIRHQTLLFSSINNGATRLNVYFAVSLVTLGAVWGNLRYT
jgi:hypothetical protein